LILLLTATKKTVVSVGATACVVALVITGMFGRRLWRRQLEKVRDNGRNDHGSRRERDQVIVEDSEVGSILDLEAGTIWA
jgi:hypothetical protein